MLLHLYRECNWTIFFTFPTLAHLTSLLYKPTCQKNFTKHRAKFWTLPQLGISIWTEEFKAFMAKGVNTGPLWSCACLFQHRGLKEERGLASQGGGAGRTGAERRESRARHQWLEQAVNWSTRRQQPRQEEWFTYLLLYGWFIRYRYPRHLPRPGQS